MTKFDFIKAIPNDTATGWWAVIESDNKTEEIIDDCFDTAAEAEAAGRAHKSEVLAGADERRREIATEESMLQGIGAYSEIMGWD